MQDAIAHIRKNKYPLLIGFIVFFIFYSLFFWVNTRIAVLEREYINAFMEVSTKETVDLIGKLYRNIYLNFQEVKNTYLEREDSLNLYVDKAYKKGYYYSISVLKEDGTPIFVYPSGARDNLDKKKLKECFSHILFFRPNGYAVSSCFLDSPSGLLLPIYFFVNKGKERIVLEGIVKYSELLIGVIKKIEKQKPALFEILTEKEGKIVSLNPQKDVLPHFSYREKTSFVRHPIEIVAYPTKKLYETSIGEEKLFIGLLSLFVPILLSIFTFFSVRYLNKVRFDNAVNDVFYRINALLFGEEKGKIEDVLNVISEKFKIDLVTIEKGFFSQVKDITVIHNIKKYNKNKKIQKWFLEKGLNSAVLVPIFGKKHYGILIFGFKGKYNVFRDFVELGRKIGERLGIYFSILETRKELLESENRYRQLIENAPFGIRIVRKNKKGKMEIVYQNRKMDEITGYTAKEVFGKSPWKYVHPDDREFIRKKIREEVEKEETLREYEVRIIRKDGEIRYISAYPKVTTYRGVSALLVYAMDITEKKAMEKQIREKQKLATVTALVGGVIHNINNTMTGIYGYMGFLERALEEGDIEKAYSRIEKINKGLSSVKSVMDGFLSIIRKRKYTIKNVDMKDVIKNIINMAKTFTRGKEIEFLEVLPGEPLIAKGDVESITHIFMNIVKNAIEAIEDRGTVTIGGRNVGEMVEVSVKDTGCGMKEEELEHIFDFLYTTKETGTGLGLCTVRDIIKDLNGKIEVESKPGKGTIFRVFLPKGEGIDVEEEEPIIERGNGETILLVDDEEAILDAGKEMLLSLGYNVFATSNPYKALELYRNHRDEIDLVILDVVMPRMSGVELFSKIKDMDKDANIIFSSGYTTDTLNEEIKDKKLEVKLSKPYNIEKLSHIVKESLRR